MTAVDTIDRMKKIGHKNQHKVSYETQKWKTRDSVYRDTVYCQSNFKAAFVKFVAYLLYLIRLIESRWTLWQHF